MSSRATVLRKTPHAASRGPDRDLKTDTNRTKMVRLTLYQTQGGYKTTRKPQYDHGGSCAGVEGGEVTIGGEGLGGMGL